MVRSDSDDGVWSKTAEESNPWLRVLSALRRDSSRQVHRSSYVAVGTPADRPAETSVEGHSLESL